MKVEIRIPEVGESVREALLAQWYRKSGEKVRKDDVLFVIETDKVTLEIAAEADGVLQIMVPEGETVAIGSLVGLLDTEGAVGAGSAVQQQLAPEPVTKEGHREMRDAAPESPVPGPPPAASGQPSPVDVAASVRQLAAEKGVDLSGVQGTGPAGRVTRGDVLLAVEARAGETEEPGTSAPARGERETAHRPAAREAERPTTTIPMPEARPGGEERITRKPMSRIRLRIAEHLLEARRNTAMLTTFNEIDMSRAQQFRSRYKEAFRKKYGIGLGFMSFFVKAAVEALKEYPEVNAFIDGKDMVYHHYQHIGVAVGAERGLVVPVIRHADGLSFAEIERAIADFVVKINENRIDLSDLEGGTFTISNGGVYGSLLSTPILNHPQSGILGMHKIEDRPVVVEGQILIRPMMYVALSYDHRIIDGREAVGFLKRIKECVEDPERMLFAV
jgi:2-oxoglutarate dehydrogenase E2 component (dihydrolipoamide succinyltransferase)